MTFRDDHDAALARADALEREVRRLREENENLRAELEPLAREAEREQEQRAREAEREQEQRAREAEQAKEMRAEIERLAERAKQQTSTPKRERKRRDPAKDAARKRLFALRNAFAGRLLDMAFVLGALIVGAGSFFTGLWVVLKIGVRFPPLVILVPAAFVAAAIGTGYLVWIALADVQIRRTRRWLAALPVSLDVERYVDHMATHFSGRLVLELDIEGAAGDEELLADAVRGGMPSTTAEWSNGTLVVTSPTLETYYPAKGGGVTHNAKVHRWFVRFAKRVLMPIAARHRVTLRIRKP